MRRFLLAGVALILLALGGLGAAAMLGLGPLAKLIGPSHGKQAAADPVAAEPKTRNLPIGSYIIPIIDRRTISRQIALDLELQINPAAGELVTAQMPRLRNLYLFRLYELIPHHSDPGSADDRKVIREDLLRAGNGLLGQGVIEDVIIKSIYQR